MEYLHQQGVKMTLEFARIIILRDDLRMVEYAFHRGCPFQHTLVRIIKSAQCLQIIHDAQVFDWTTHFVTNSIWLGARTEVIDRMCAVGCIMSVHCAPAAVNLDRLDVLKVLCAHNCPTDDQCITQALILDKFDFVVYAHQHGCCVPDDVCEIAIRYNRARHLRYFIRHGFELSEKHLEWFVTVKTQKICRCTIM